MLVRPTSFLTIQSIKHFVSLFQEKNDDIVLISKFLDDGSHQCQKSVRCKASIEALPNTQHREHNVSSDTECTIL